MVVAAIANGGEVMAPYLVKEIQSQELDTVQTTEPDRIGRAVDSSVAATLTELMVNNENSYSGSGKLTGVQIAAKTGTAEHGADAEVDAAARLVRGVRAGPEPRGRGGGARRVRRRPQQPGRHRRRRGRPDRARRHRPGAAGRAVIVLAAGQHIADRYQLDRRIAVGGMGEVWEASDNRLGRSVAVKILRPELSGDPEFLHRFRIEARTVASLDHHGIAAVHDYGESEGLAGRATAYLVMELVRGEPLSTLIARGPIEPDETLRLLEEAAWALQAAHERGFVHRDVKPGNILVRTDGMVKLTDFGIAKAADAVPVTRSGMVMGTAHYIAPEQASGARGRPGRGRLLAGHRRLRVPGRAPAVPRRERGGGGHDAGPRRAAAAAGHRSRPRSASSSRPPWSRTRPSATRTGGEFAEAVAAVRRGEPVPVPASISGSTRRADARRGPARRSASPVDRAGPATHRASGRGRVRPRPSPPNRAPPAPRRPPPGPVDAAGRRSCRWSCSRPPDRAAVCWWCCSCC